MIIKQWHASATVYLQLSRKLGNKPQYSFIIRIQALQIQRKYMSFLCSGRLTNVAHKGGRGYDVTKK